MVDVDARGTATVVVMGSPDSGVAVTTMYEEDRAGIGLRIVFVVNAQAVHEDVSASSS